MALPSIMCTEYYVYFRRCRRRHRRRRRRHRHRRRHRRRRRRRRRCRRGGCAAAAGRPRILKGSFRDYLVDVKMD